MCKFLNIEDFTLLQQKSHNRAGTARSLYLQKILRRPNTLKTFLGRTLPRSLKYRAVQKLLDMNKKQQSYPELSAALKDRLRLEFQDEVCRLEAIIKRDLSHWK